MVNLLVVSVLSLTVIAKPDLANWMGESLAVIGDLSLKNLTLPGTHDSGSYYLTKSIIPGDASEIVEAAVIVSEELGLPVEDVITQWSQAQDLNVYQQMEGGIRYIDLRCGWYKDDWHTFHWEIGDLCKYLLQNATEFLATHPNEIVVIEISHFDGNPSSIDIYHLEDMVISILGSYLYYVDPTFSASVDYLIATNQRALVTMEKSSGRYKNIWSSDSIHNTYADSDKKSKMEDYNKDHIKDYLAGEHSDALYKISWTLTPAADTILKGPLPDTPNNLEELADSANNDLVSFYKTLKSKNLVPWGNIVIIDHFEKSQLLNVIFDMNGISPLN